MTINKAKTKELVFCRPQFTIFDMPDPLDGIAQERSAKLLGVIFTGKLSFEDHVDFVMIVCSQRVYLRSQGLPIQQLHMLFVVFILSCIIYALLVWGGHSGHFRQLQERLDASLKQARKFGFGDANYTMAELLDKTDAGCWAF